MTGVAVAALAVSFLSSAKARGGKAQVVVLRSQVEKLTQTAKVLEESLKETQEKYSQETLATKGLKEALVREEFKTQTLAEELDRLKEKSSQSAKATTSKPASSNIVAGSATQ